MRHWIYALPFAVLTVNAFKYVEPTEEQLNAFNKNGLDAIFEVEPEDLTRLSAVPNGKVIFTIEILESSRVLVSKKLSLEDFESMEKPFVKMRIPGKPVGGNIKFAIYLESESEVIWRSSALGGFKWSKRSLLAESPSHTLPGSIKFEEWTTETVSAHFEEIPMMASGLDYDYDEIIFGRPHRKVPETTVRVRREITLNDDTADPIQTNQPAGWFAVTPFKHLDLAYSFDLNNYRLCFKWRKGSGEMLEPVNVPHPAAQWLPRVLVTLHQHSSPSCPVHTAIAFQFFPVDLQKGCMNFPASSTLKDGRYFLEYQLAFPAGPGLQYFMEPLDNSPTFQIGNSNGIGAGSSYSPNDLCPLEAKQLPIKLKLPFQSTYLPAESSNTFRMIKSDLLPFSKHSLDIKGNALQFDLNIFYKSNLLVRSALHERNLKFVLMRMNGNGVWETIVETFRGLKGQVLPVGLPLNVGGNQPQSGIYSVQIWHINWIRGTNRKAKEKLLLEVGPILVW